MGDFVMSITVVLFFMSACRTWAHGHSHSPSSSPQVIAFKQKWGVKDIVRDVDHLKEDLSQMMELQNNGMLTHEEALFYFFRMHDFDDNEKLDGIELITAVGHTVAHSLETEPHEGAHDHRQNIPMEQLSEIIDNFLQYDKDKDGFVSYTEMKTQMN